MSRFDNKLCPICRIPLNEHSDVVVCPECGTPHHRACYLKNNCCGVESWHASGFVWNGYLPDEQPEEATQTEQPEAAQQAENAEQSEHAGNTSNAENARQDSPSTENDPHRAEYPGGTPNSMNNMDGMGGMNIDDLLNQMRNQTMDETRGEDGVSSKELSYFVGRSVMHYSQAFAAFRAPVRPGQKKHRIFLNLCSGLFAPVHQFYRRMDLAGAALLFIELLYYVPTVFYAMGIGSLGVLRNVQLAMGALNFAAMVVMFLFGDYIYYRLCVRKIKKIRMSFDDGRAEGYYQALTDSGSPSWLRAIIAILLVYLAQACIMLLLNRLGQI